MKFVFAILLCVTWIEVGAQYKFDTGYVITSSSDTIKGLISVSLNGVKIITQQGRRRYEVQDIQYAVAGQSRFVNSKYLTPAITDSVLTTRAILLEVLMQGDINLYYRPRLHRNDNTTFYFNELDSGFMSLYKSQKTIRSGGREFVMRLEPYRKILSDHLKDCHQLREKVDYLSPSTLIELLSSYASCKGLREQFVRKRMVPELYLTPIVGLAVWNVQFSSATGSLSTFNFKGTPRTSTAPLLGVEFELLFPRKPLGFGFGLTYSSFDYKGDSTYNPTNFTTSVTTISRTFTSTFLSGKYIVPFSKHLNFEAEAGFGLILPLKSDYQKVIVDGDEIKTETDFAFSSFGTNFFIGANVRYDHLSVFFRWTSFLSQNTRFAYVTDQVNGYGLGLRYMFNLSRIKPKS